MPIRLMDKSIKRPLRIVLKDQFIRVFMNIFLMGNFIRKLLLIKLKLVVNFIRKLLLKLNLVVNFIRKLLLITLMDRSRPIRTFLKCESIRVFMNIYLTFRITQRRPDKSIKFLRVILVKLRVIRFISKPELDPLTGILKIFAQGIIFTLRFIRLDPHILPTLNRILDFLETIIEVFPFINFPPVTHSTFLIVWLLHSLKTLFQ